MGQLVEIKQSEDSRQSLLVNLEERERQQREQRIRAMADRHIPEWDPEWGGPKPYSADESRRKLGLKEQAPPPWYKRIARFYNENWEYMFEGVGPALIVIAMVTMGLLVFVQLGKTTGWWGGMM